MLLQVCTSGTFDSPITQPLRPVLCGDYTHLRGFDHNLSEPAAQVQTAPREELPATRILRRDHPTCKFTVFTSYSTFLMCYWNKATRNDGSTQAHWGLHGKPTTVPSHTLIDSLCIGNETYPGEHEGDSADVPRPRSPGGRAGQNHWSNSSECSLIPSVLPQIDDTTERTNRTETELRGAIHRMKRMRKLKCCVVCTIVVLLLIAGLCGILLVKTVLLNACW